MKDEIIITPEPNIIPTNSASFLVDSTTSRFNGAIWYKEIQKQEIILAGAGGIGSFTGLMLARLAIKELIIFDFDVIESVNMSGQWYSKDVIGEYKVNALCSMIRAFNNNTSCIGIPEAYTEDSITRDIMICGFDNMRARELFFKSWLEHISKKSPEERSKCLFIDGRLAAEEFQILAITGNDTYNIDQYHKNYIFSDLVAVEAVCSYKQTTFMANMIGSYIANIFVNFVANQCNPLIDRPVPFYTTYSSESMFFKTVF